MLLKFLVKTYRKYCFMLKFSVLCLWHILEYQINDLNWFLQVVVKKIRSTCSLVFFPRGCWAWIAEEPEFDQLWWDQPVGNLRPSSSCRRRAQEATLPCGPEKQKKQPKTFIIEEKDILNQKKKQFNGQKIQKISKYCF